VRLLFKDLPLAIHDRARPAHEAARYGAELVVTLDDPALADYQPETWAAALRQVLERERPHVLLIPASARGREYGPLAAGRLELGMTGDCVGLGIDRAGRLIQTKPAYGGNIVSVIMGATTPQLATVRPRMFELVEPRDGEAEVRRLELGPLPAPRARRLGSNEGAAWRLDEADVVVCVGHEAGGPEGVAEIERIVEPLGAAVGGDRAACEADWLAHNRQIGLYGRSVAPRLYLAVGVEGGFEHATASVKAGVIAALATAGAASLDEANLALEGDWRETLPQLVQRLR